MFWYLILLLLYVIHMIMFHDIAACDEIVYY